MATKAGADESGKPFEKAFKKIATKRKSNIACVRQNGAGSARLYLCDTTPRRPFAKVCFRAAS